MTRINCGIPVKCLTDEHLLAEHREIVRIPWYLTKAIDSRSINSIPNELCLGTGHVKFFLNKVKYIKERYSEIYKELISRGIKATWYGDCFGKIETKYLNGYVPSVADKILLTNRISDRIKESPKDIFHYYKDKITKEKALDLLSNAF